MVVGLELTSCKTFSEKSILKNKKYKIEKVFTDNKFIIINEHGSQMAFNRRDLLSFFKIEPEERNRVILELLTEDYNTREIAEKLNYSLPTIEKDIKRLKENFGVTTLHALVFRYVRRKYMNNLEKHAN